MALGHGLPKPHDGNPAIAPSGGRESSRGSGILPRIIPNSGPRQLRHLAAGRVDPPTPQAGSFPARPRVGSRIDPKGSRPPWWASHFLAGKPSSAAVLALGPGGRAWPCPWTGCRSRPFHFGQEARMAIGEWRREHRGISVSSLWEPPATPSRCAGWRRGRSRGNQRRRPACREGTGPTWGPRRRQGSGTGSRWASGQGSSFA